MNKQTEKNTNAKREKQMHELWNERGYDKPYLSKLNDKDLDVLWATEFYHEKMVTGGKVNDWYSKLKEGAKSTYSKGKAYTQKQVHDLKKKVAIDVLEDTKKKTPKTERNVITNAKRILAKRYGTGGRAGDYPSFKVTKIIRVDDEMITPGHYTYTGKERGGKGVYMNGQNYQTAGFDLDKIKRLKSLFPDSIEMVMETGGNVADNFNKLFLKMIISTNRLFDNLTAQKFENLYHNTFIFLPKNKTPLNRSQLYFLPIFNVEESVSKNKINIEDCLDIKTIESNFYYSQRRSPQTGLGRLHQIANNVDENANVSSPAKLKQYLVQNSVRLDSVNLLDELQKIFSFNNASLYKSYQTNLVTNVVSNLNPKQYDSSGYFPLLGVLKNISSSFKPLSPTKVYYYYPLDEDNQYYRVYIHPKNKKEGYVAGFETESQAKLFLSLIEKFKNTDDVIEYLPKAKNKKMETGGKVEKHLENAQQMLSHGFSSGFTRKKWDMIKDEIAMSKDSEVMNLANKISLGMHSKNSDFSDLFYTIKMKTEKKMSTGGGVGEYNIKNKTKYWIYDGDNLEMAGTVSILPNNHIQIKDSKGFVYSLSLLKQKYKNLKFKIYEKFEAGGGVGEHTNPTLNDMCTITVEGDIKTQPNNSYTWEDNYLPVYENDLIQLRIYESALREGAYDVTIISRNKYWWEFPLKDMRKRSKPYVDEIKSQVNSLLEKEGIKLKSLKMYSGRASMETGGNVHNKKEWNAIYSRGNGQQIVVVKAKDKTEAYREAEMSRQYNKLGSDWEMIDLYESKFEDGGEIVGYLKSGKPVYDETTHPAHSDFTPLEHKEAAKLLRKMVSHENPNLSKKVSELSEKYNKYIDSSWEHEQWAKQQKEKSTDMSRMETGGKLDEVITINVDNYPYYLKKEGDTTHFRMANSKEGVSIVIPSHIGQHRGEPYYSDIASWLKGGANPDGKSYTGSRYGKGGGVGEFWAEINESTMNERLPSDLRDVNEDEDLISGNIWIKFKKSPLEMPSYDVKQAISEDFQYFGYGNQNPPKQVSLMDGSWGSFYIEVKNLTLSEISELLLNLPEQVQERLQDKKIRGYKDLGFDTYGQTLDLRVTQSEDEEEYGHGGSIGKKVFNQMSGVGSSKYVVNFHDGKKTHKDGSPFFDIAIFKNKVALNKFIDKLQEEGYTQGYANGGSMYANGGVIEKELSDLEFSLKATENSLKWVQQQTSVTNQFYKRKVQNGKMTRERARKLMDEASVSWAKQREEEREKIKNIKAKIERLMSLRDKISKSEYATGGNITDGVVGQEILFDYLGEEKTGVIREVTNAGDYVVNSDDGRTLLAQVDRDVIELRGMRKKAAPETPRKLFGFFDEGGNVDSIQYSSNLASTWYTSEVITSDLKKYIVECYNRGGDDLAETVVSAIQRGINEARNIVDGIEPAMPSQFTPVEQEWTKDDQNALEGLISDIQTGMGWISPDYVEESWTSRRGPVGTRDWNPAIARKVYQEMIDSDILYADDENEAGEKINTVSEAIEYAEQMG